MPKTIFNPQELQELDNRLTRLAPDSPGRFGTMTPATMICHLKDSLEVATGLAPARQRKSLMSNPILRRLIIYHMPWPKGKAKTVPELLATKPADWNADIERLRGLLKAAAARGADGDWSTHPAFGRVSGRDYGVLIYKHFNHHLGQFGV